MFNRGDRFCKPAISNLIVHQFHINSAAVGVALRGQLSTRSEFGDRTVRDANISVEMLAAKLPIHIQRPALR
jgi:hypothetical protein